VNRVEKRQTGERTRAKRKDGRKRNRSVGQLGRKEDGWMDEWDIIKRREEQETKGKQCNNGEGKRALTPWTRSLFFLPPGMNAFEEEVDM